MFAPLAAKHGRTSAFFNPASANVSFHAFVMKLTGSQGTDDVVVCVPVATLMEEADTVMKVDGMMVLFAGVPNGTYGGVNSAMGICRTPMIPGRLG